MATVITFGTFDLFHVGHLNILQRAKRLGSRLIVGVSSDALNFRKKNRYPLTNQEHRMNIVGALKCVDEVFLEESMDLKPHYIQSHGADILVMGDDWAGKFDDMPCTVQYFPRTPSISTTELIECIVNSR
jgi:choline-phosphate cytidylyltransferase